MIPFTYNTVKLYGPRTYPCKRTVVYFAIGHPHYDDDVDDDDDHHHHKNHYNYLYNTSSDSSVGVRCCVLEQDASSKLLSTG